MPKTKTRSNNAAAAAPVDNPQPKTRGSQKGTTATQHEDNLPTNGQTSEETVTQKQPPKRSRQAAAIPGDAEGFPPAKKGRKAKDTAATNDPLVEQLAPSLPAPKAARPTRVAANAKTADAPKRRRRTKEEIAADQEAKCRAAEELIRKAEEAKAFLAQMDVDEEQADARMERENPRRLSAVKGKRSAQAEESDGESFEEVSPSSGEGEIEIVVSTVFQDHIPFALTSSTGEEDPYNKKTAEGSAWRCRGHRQQATWRG